MDWTAKQLCSRPEVSDIYRRYGTKRTYVNPKPRGRPARNGGTSALFRHMLKLPAGWYSLRELAESAGIAMTQASWGVRYLRKIGMLDTRYENIVGRGPRAARYRLAAHCRSDPHALQSAT